MAALLILLGLTLLYLGGELLVSNSSKLGVRAGISPLVVGLTIVAFATSSPELFASVTAVYQGSSGLSLGTVLGSNIANLGLILGLAAVVRPLRPRRSFVRREVPQLVAIAILPVALFANGSLGRVEGVIMLGLLIAYVLYTLRFADGDSDEVPAPEEAQQARLVFVILGLLGGLGMLVLGAKLTVDGSVGIARTLGVSERMIGLSMVAFGTSLPELASSLAAARRQEGEIVLGNIVGSNIFNVLCVLGVTVILLPVQVDPSEIALEIWFGIGLSLALLPLVALRGKIGRLEGALLTCAYGVYVYLIYN